MGDKKIILSVDDVALNLLMIKKALSPHFDVRTAKSAELALFMLGSIKVDLLLLDIEMPGMSGFEFLEILKDIPQIQDIPLMFVTSHVSNGFLAQASKAGAKAYIIKPIDHKVLRQKVFDVFDMPLPE